MSVSDFCQELSDFVLAVETNNPVRVDQYLKSGFSASLRILSQLLTLTIVRQQPALSYLLAEALVKHPAGDREILNQVLLDLTKELDLSNLELWLSLFDFSLASTDQFLSWLIYQAPTVLVEAVTDNPSVSEALINLTFFSAVIANQLEVAAIVVKSGRVTEANLIQASWQPQVVNSSLGSLIREVI